VAKRRQDGRHLLGSATSFLLVGTSKRRSGNCGQANLAGMGGEMGCDSGMYLPRGVGMICLVKFDMARDASAPNRLLAPRNGHGSAG
jgi:hypothetical protein